MASPSVLPDWHRGCDDTLWLRPCAVMVVQKKFLTVTSFNLAVQLVSDVVQVNVVLSHTQTKVQNHKPLEMHVHSCK